MNTVVEKFFVTPMDRQADVNNSGIFPTRKDAYDYISNQRSERFMITPVYESVPPCNLYYRATLVVVCYMHPQKTKRAIESACAQDATGLEILIIGDSCPNIHNLIMSGYLREKQIEQQMRGNDLTFYNLPQNMGGYGFAVRNEARRLTRGAYTLYLDNDDIIEPNHVSHRLAVAEKYKDVDLLAFETKIDTGTTKFTRLTEWQFGSIGHSEIMIKTDFLKNLPMTTPEYGHDWKLIKDAIKSGATKYIERGEPRTYIVKSLLNNREQGID